MVDSLVKFDNNKCNLVPFITYIFSNLIYFCFKADNFLFNNSLNFLYKIIIVPNFMKT